MGPSEARKHKTTQPMFREIELNDGNDADVDAFVGWTFRRLDPMPAAAEPVPASMSMIFDDEAPSTVSLTPKIMIHEEPSILESASLPPDDYTLGSLPPGFDDGQIAIRHLPLVEERAAAPTPAPAKKPAPKRSLSTAVAFLVAGCAAGAVVGLVNTQMKQPKKTPTTTTTLAAAPAPAPLPPPPVQSVAQAEAALPVPMSPLPSLAPLTPMKQEKPKKKETATTLASTTLASTKPAKKQEALLASPGRLEIQLPEGGKVKRTFALSKPSRVVVDLVGASLPGKPIDVDEGGVVQLRFGHPDAKTERVVVIVAGGGDKPAQPKATLDGDRLNVTWTW